MPELRKSYRYNFKNVVTSPKLKGLRALMRKIRGKNSEFTVVDISPFGMQFISDLQFDKNTTHDFQLKLPIYPELLEVTGAVRWVRKGGGRGGRDHFLIGIKFMEYGFGVKDKLKTVTDAEDAKNMRK